MPSVNFPRYQSMRRHMRNRPFLMTLLGASALAGCAGNPAISDRLVEDPGAQAFLDKVEQNCGTLSVGGQQLKYLLSISSDDTYFIDESSKLYFGRVDRATYASDIEAFYPGGDSQAALDCIFEQLGG
jgi:hypothetical protein